MSKKNVIKQYTEDYKLFLAMLQRIPLSLHDEKFLGGWGIKQITAHIASWNWQTTQGIQTVTEGGIPWFFDDEDKINEFNAEIIERGKGKTLQHNLQETKVSHRDTSFALCHSVLDTESIQIIIDIDSRLRGNDMVQIV